VAAAEKPETAKQEKTEPPRVEDPTVDAAAATEEVQESDGG
jgi:hypothetical protein